MSDKLALRTDSLLLLEQAGALTPTELRLEVDISFDRYEALGAIFGRLHDASKWWIGDWLLYGEDAFAEEAAQAAEATRRSVETLRNYAWVCRRVPPSLRNDSLTFTHHQYVAPLENAAEQKEWLERAEAEGWSSRELHEELKRARLAATRIDVHEVISRAADRLAASLDPLGEVVDVRIVVEVAGGETYRAQATHMPVIEIDKGDDSGRTAAAVELVTCARHGRPTTVDKVVAGITYLACGCHTTGDEA